MGIVQQAFERAAALVAIGTINFDQLGQLEPPASVTDQLALAGFINYDTAVREVWQNVLLFLQRLNNAISLANQENTLTINIYTRLRHIFSNYGYSAFQMNTTQNLNMLVQRHVKPEYQQQITGLAPVINDMSAAYATSSKNSLGSDRISHYGLSVEMLVRSIIVRPYGVRYEWNDSISQLYSCWNKTGI